MGSLCLWECACFSSPCLFFVCAASSFCCLYHCFALSSLSGLSSSEHFRLLFYWYCHRSVVYTFGSCVIWCTFHFIPDLIKQNFPRKHLPCGRNMWIVQAIIISACVRNIFLYYNLLSRYFHWIRLVWVFSIFMRVYLLDNYFCSLLLLF